MNAFIVYGTRVYDPNWESSANMDCLTFRLRSAGSMRSPSETRDAVVDGKLWASMKLNHEPTDWCTVRAGEVWKKDLVRKLPWADKLRLATLLVSCGSREHYARVMQAETEEDLFLVERDSVSDFSTAHRALGNKTEEEKMKKMVHKKDDTLQAMLKKMGPKASPQDITIQTAKEMGPFTARYKFSKLVVLRSLRIFGSPCFSTV